MTTPKSLLKYRMKHRAEIAAKNREYYRKNRDRILEQIKLYQSKNREKINKRNLGYHKRNRIKRIARVAAGYYKSEIIKEKCENCGSTNKLEMHHPDHKNKLNVVTLCHYCHSKLQRKYPEEYDITKFELLESWGFAFDLLTPSVQEALLKTCLD